MIRSVSRPARAQHNGPVAWGPNPCFHVRQTSSRGTSKEKKKKKEKVPRSDRVLWGPLEDERRPAAAADSWENRARAKPRAPRRLPHATVLSVIPFVLGSRSRSRSLGSRSDHGRNLRRSFGGTETRPACVSAEHRPERRDARTSAGTLKIKNSPINQTK